MRSEIVRCDQEIRGAVPDAAPVTLALPYGVHPEQPTSALRGQGYSYRGVFLVGAGLVGQTGRRPALRYTSDGDPAHVSYPGGADQQVAATYLASARRY